MLYPQVILLDGNQRSTLAVARALGKHGVPVVVASDRSGALASVSRYCHISIRCPNAETDGGAFREWLSSLPRKFPGAVLLPMTDTTVPLCLAERADLPSIRLPFPALDAYKSVTDKGRLFILCQERGVDAPRTRVIRTLTDLDNLASFSEYPIVVKPNWSAATVNGAVLRQPVRYARHRAELTDMVAHALGQGAPAVLLQEYVPGEGRGVFALFDRGRVVVAFAHRRLREKPPTGGVSVLSESTPVDPEMLEAMTKVLAPLLWHGVAMAEFKVAPTGRKALIEINARFWGSLQLAIDCGIDFPSMLYELALGHQPAVPAGYTVGRRLRWYLGDVDHLYLRFRDRSYSSLREKLCAVVDTITPWHVRTRLETFRLTDPRPFLAELSQYVRSL
jgi:predicted ATP-grasp superfamily ATP-dependent carboligase